MIPTCRVLCSTLRHTSAVSRFIISLRFSSSTPVWLVCGGGVCRRHHRSAGEPRLSQRPGVPHLRLRHDHCAVLPDPLQDSVLLLYIGGVILPSALELVGGWALYKLYHTRWWDYSDFPFNIGGYICLEFSLLWGVGTLVVMRHRPPGRRRSCGYGPALCGLCRYVCALCSLRGRRSRYGLCRLRSPGAGCHGAAG